jgi:hypothetical protein
MDNEEFEVEFDEVTNIGGAVNSVNGKTGDVVLNTADLENTSDYQTGSEVEDAINQAISGIVVPTKTSDLTNDGADGSSTYVEASELATRLDGLSLKSISQADYDALTTKDANTLYVISEA